MILTTLLEAGIVDAIIQGVFGTLALTFNTEKFYDLVGCGVLWGRSSRSAFRGRC